MIRRPPRSTRVRSSAASDVYKRQADGLAGASRLSSPLAIRSVSACTDTCLYGGWPRDAASDRAEPDGALLGRADVDVADRGHRDDHAPPRSLGEVEHATVGQRRGDQSFDLIRGLFGLQHDLARDVLHADLDLHGKAFRQSVDV